MTIALKDSAKALEDRLFRSSESLIMLVESDCDNIGGMEFGFFQLSRFLAFNQYLMENKTSMYGRELPEMVICFESRLYSKI